MDGLENAIWITQYPGKEGDHHEVYYLACNSADDARYLMKFLGRYPYPEEPTEQVSPMEEYAVWIEVILDGELVDEPRLAVSPELAEKMLLQFFKAPRWALRRLRFPDDDLPQGIRKDGPRVTLDPTAPAARIYRLED